MGSTWQKPIVILSNRLVLLLRHMLCYALYIASMKKVSAYLSVFTALFLSLPFAKAAEFTWSPHFPYVYSFNDEGWLWYSTVGTDGIYAFTLGGPNDGNIVELVAPTPSNAPESISDKTFTVNISGRDNAVTFQFKSDGTFIESGTDDGEPYTETGSYTYYKSGFNGGIIIAEFNSETALFFAVLDFTTATSGTLTYKFVSATFGDFDNNSASFAVE